MALAAAGVLVLLGALAALVWRRRVARRLRTMALVRASWGAVTSRTGSLELHRWFARTSSATMDAIDDDTWNDLQLDAVHGRVDDTLTLPGQLLLYRMLRHPLASPEALLERHRAAAAFLDQPALRESTQMWLLPLRNAIGGVELVELLWNPLPSVDRLARVYTVMTALAMVLVAAAAMTQSGLALALLGAVFAANFYLHHRIKTGHEPTVLAFQYLSRLLSTAEKLASVPHPDLPGRRALTPHVRACARLRRRLAALSPLAGSGGVAFEYLSILFLIESRACLGALDLMAEHRPAAQEALLGVGEIDAQLSIASYRASLAEYAVPTLAPGSGRLSLTDAVHPLLAQPQPFSFELHGKPILVTGPNMSGKSTFLRTIGLNAVLAQTICTCTARRYEADCFRVTTSLSVSDDLLAGRSLYVAEAERLLLMIRTRSDDRLPLFLIDEILKGTNTVERVASAIEILRHLSLQRAVTFAATHDTIIAGELGDAFEAYHFSVQAGPEVMAFDHRPRPGISTARNAIRLLAVLGFPPEIVERAAQRVDRTEGADTPAAPPPAIVDL